MAKFIDLLGYREITLKSDTEPAIIVIRNLVAEMYKAEVIIEDADNGYEESNGLIEHTVMLTRGMIRTSRCHIESSTQELLNGEINCSAVVGGTCKMYAVQMSKSRDGKTPSEKRSNMFVPRGEKVLTKQISTEPMNRLNPRYKFGIWLGVRHTSA